ncbi:MAG: hypothetical protein R3D80_06375 [Paracoccaceae bacterium]|nr:hypothetical protein [Maritimibacter sp.]
MDSQFRRHRIIPGRKLRSFLVDEAGAVTVDWVVLTGMIVLLGMAAAFSVGANIPGLASDVGTYVGDTEIGVLE